MKVEIDSEDLCRLQREAGAKERTSFALLRKQQEYADLVRERDEWKSKAEEYCRWLEIRRDDLADLLADQTSASDNLHQFKKHLNGDKALPL